MASPIHYNKNKSSILFKVTKLLLVARNWKTFFKVYSEAWIIENDGRNQIHLRYGAIGTLRMAWVNIITNEGIENQVHEETE